MFRKDDPNVTMPGIEYNCRCYAQEVPDYILILDDIAQSKAFNLYLRKGITHPLLFVKQW